MSFVTEDHELSAGDPAPAVAAFVRYGRYPAVGLEASAQPLHLTDGSKQASNERNSAIDGWRAAASAEAFFPIARLFNMKRRLSADSQLRGDAESCRIVLSVDLHALRSAVRLFVSQL